jgi:hypothetical protein
LENAPPLFAQLEDDIERYHANFHGRIQSSANFLRQVHESDFVVEVAKWRSAWRKEATKKAQQRERGEE